VGHPLDDVVWNSATGPQTDLTTRHGDAVAYLSEIAPFAAVRDGASPAAWRDLAELLGPEGMGAIVGPSAELPRGWRVLERMAALQLAASPGATFAVDRPVAALTPDDVPDMIQLVEIAQPGPFRSRTIEFGGYVGVRDTDGTLVAMGGTRMHCDGFTELSAICTLPSHRGQGLGAAMVHAVAGSVKDRGEQPFLHVLASNTNAIRLYEALGFVVRRAVDVVVVTPAAD
jgi:ribosomal protein S18 acetylase RimI-like enzyme